jgi:hypothetical protein
MDHALAPSPHAFSTVRRDSKHARRCFNGMSRCRWVLSAAVGLVVAVFALRTRGQPTGVSNPLATVEAWRPALLQGHVVTHLDAGPYVYVLVEDEAGQAHWVAALAATASREHEVEVTVFGVAPQFQSRRLGRAFSPLLFGSIRSHVSPNLESQ